MIEIISNCQRRLLSALAFALVSLSVDSNAQGIVYEHLSTPTNTPYTFPEDSLGMRLLGEFAESWNLLIDGQTQFTFVSGSGFDVIPSAQNAIIAVPVDDFGANFAIPLTNRQSIGPDAAGYAWIASGSVGGSVLADSRASGEIGNPYLVGGLFAYVESAYVGLQFQQNSNTYYGWANVGAPYPIFNGGWIYSYAFETSPNTPINAGQISEPISFNANLSGVNEVPLNRTHNSGKGTFTLESFEDCFVLTYHLELDGSFRPTDAGIFGPPIRAGRPPVLIADCGMAQIVFSPPLAPPGLVPFVSAKANLNPPIIVLPPPSHIVYDGQINVTSNQVAQLLRGQLYVNLQSAKFRQGELRGQIWPSAPIQFSATLSSHTEFSRNQNVPRGEAQFTLSGTALSYEIAVDTSFTRIIAGIYGPRICQSEVGNRIIWLNTTNRVQVPAGGFANEPGLPGQWLYSGQLTLPDTQISELDNAQSYLEVLAPGCRNGWIDGRITQNP